MTAANATRLISMLILAATLSACGFSKLKDDLERYEEQGDEFNGSLALDGIESTALLVVAMHDSDGADLYSFRVLADPDVFEFKGKKEPLYFFAFDDQNKDLAFQPGEPFARNTGAGPVAPNTGTTNDSHLVISADSASREDYPRGLVDVNLLAHDVEMGLNFVIGDVSSLDNPLFSEEQAKKGLWEPYAFMADGGTGIHFLEAYDPDRIPVLFVHGVNGTPRNFTALIDGLDRTRYQAWVFSYPSGLRLKNVASGVVDFARTLRHQYEFDQLHLIAHSMGGLVSQGAVNLCMKKDTCDYLRSYTTLSTPWNGVASAKSGIKWAPTVVPVWNDIDPDSEYVTTLFDTPLSKDVPYYLLFGFKQSSIFGSDSSDGVIKLTSQLRNAAQEQASMVRGYDESHVSILSSEVVIEKVYEILDANSD